MSHKPTPPLRGRVKFDTSGPVATMLVERIALADLHEDPANLRTHDERNLAAIGASLAEHGQVEPLVVQKSTGLVIGGNGRLVAMGRLGWTHCDVNRLDISDAAARTLAIRLNRTAELAGWNGLGLAEALRGYESEDGFDLGTIGFSSEEVDALCESLADAALEAAPKEPRSRAGGADLPPNKYELVFDSVEQHERWYAFLAWLGTQPEYEAETAAGRIDRFLASEGHAAAEIPGMIFGKKYLTEDVLAAARRRCDQILQRFDSFQVAFSGGKDSLVTLHLMAEACSRAGLSRPVRVMFLDEELIPSAVADFVAEHRGKPWLDLRWYGYPLKSNKVVLGRVFDYVQWDPSRPHVRTLPAWAIRPRPGDLRTFDQYMMMSEATRDLKGRVANVTGIRADESLNRYASVAFRAVENWQASTPDPRVVHCKPIYDWSENDIFKYLVENGIKYCPLYDWQLWDNTPLRVSTPVHSGSAARFDAWRRLDPEFHERVTRVFPEMMAHERYRAEIVRSHGNSFEEFEAWIHDNVDPGYQGKARDNLRNLRQIHAQSPLTASEWKVIWNAFTGGWWLKAPILSTRTIGRTGPKSKAKAK